MFVCQFKLLYEHLYFLNVIVHDFLFLITSYFAAKSLVDFRAGQLYPYYLAIYPLKGPVFFKVKSINVMKSQF